MGDLEQLETERGRLYGELSQIGDFRRGSIVVSNRRCGKPNCACANPEHPGHGPQYRLTTKVGGKTHVMNIKPGPQLRKLEREVANHHRFRELTRKIVEVSEQICDLRPISPEEQDASSAAEALKKTSSKRSRRSSSGRPTP